MTATRLLNVMLVIIASHTGSCSPRMLGGGKNSHNKKEGKGDLDKFIQKLITGAEEADSDDSEGVVVPAEQRGSADG